MGIPKRKVCQQYHSLFAFTSAIMIFALLMCVAVAMAKDQAWEDYKLEYNKHYTAEEEPIRYANWQKEVAEVELHNAMNGEDFTQGQCGSCYSFSATGALEGAHKKVHGALPSLSEQEIVDCSGRYGNYGCRGGWYQSSWRYIKDAGGDESENAYPYTARQGRCNFNRGYVVAGVRSYHDTQPGSEQDLTAALAQVGPVSVAIDASPSSFRRYRSGVHYAPRCSSSRLNHAVLAVGFGTEGGRNYYLVKNSWGTRWGAGGYIKMCRNKRNNCGIASKPSYPMAA